MIRLFVLSLLVASAVTYRTERHKVQDGDSDRDKTVDELSPDSEANLEEQLPGVCRVCKWAMKKLKKIIRPNESPDDVKKDLLAVCDGIGFLKSLCKSFIKKHISVLTEELSTNNNEKRICTVVGACKGLNLTLTP